MTLRNLIACPLSHADYRAPADTEPCPTMLQRSITGDLIDGVRLHLLAVHNYHGPRAEAVARRWVRAQR